MIKLMLKILPLTLLLELGLAAGVLLPQESEEEYSWDCPATGYLPFRRELLTSTDQLANLLGTSEVTVVHVGFDESKCRPLRRVTYSEAHIPGARHWTWSAVLGPEETLEPAGSRADAIASIGIAPDSRIVLYDTGIGLEAAAAFVALDALGLADRASLLDGQWSRWAAEGRPLSRVAVEEEPSELPVCAAGVALSAADVRELAGRVEGPKLTLVDARAGSKGERQAFGLPAVRILWRENLIDWNIPILKREAELRRLWARVPPRSEHQVIVAATNWREAAPVYFAARLLGYSVRILDGAIEP